MLQPDMLCDYSGAVWLALFGPKLEVGTKSQEGAVLDGVPAVWGRWLQRWWSEFYCHLWSAHCRFVC